MRQTIVLILLLTTINIFSQEESLHDTIILKEVKVTRQKKNKLLNFSISGHPAFNGITKRTSKVVCLLDSLPAGKIKSVTFYFNTGLPNLFKKKLQINYKDVLLGFCAYEVLDNQEPGKIISENEIKFLVSQDHDGPLTVNVENLNLATQKMYLGFIILSDLDERESNIYVRYCENEKYKTLDYVTYKTKDDFWCGWIMEGKQNFKLDMKIIP